MSKKELSKEISYNTEWYNAPSPETVKEWHRLACALEAELKQLQDRANECPVCRDAGKRDTHPVKVRTFTSKPQDMESYPNCQSVRTVSIFTHMACGIAISRCKRVDEYVIPKRRE